MIKWCNKAIVVIAHKLLVVVWHVMTKQEADRHAVQARVARSLMQHTFVSARPYPMKNNGGSIFMMKCNP